jgi:hypothetical protein
MSVVLKGDLSAGIQPSFSRGEKGPGEVRAERSSFSHLSAVGVYTQVFINKLKAETWI